MILGRVEAHVPADAKEARDRETILSFLRSGGDPYDRKRFDPGHLTGSAFILDAAGKRLVLVHHAKLGRWLQPGGHGEPGEKDPLAVAMREALEETGIEGLKPHPEAPGLFDLDVHLIPAGKDEPAHLHLDLRFVLVAPGGAEPRASSESREARWSGLEDGLADPDLSRALSKLRRVSLPSASGTRG